MRLRPYLRGWTFRTGRAEPLPFPRGGPHDIHTLGTDADVSRDPTSGLDRFFEISQRGSTVGAEIRGGIVTFVTMAYIVILNPLILSTPDVEARS